MIKNFKDKNTQFLFETGKSKTLPTDIINRAIRKLDMLSSAETIEDMRVPPSNRLHKLSADREGQYSISVNNQWRICFKFARGNAYDVEICDYH